MGPRSTWATRYAWIVDELEGGNRSAVARNLGVTPQAVTNILDGAVPSGDTLAATLEAYGSISPRWLVTGTGPRETVADGLAAGALEEIEAVLERVRRKGR